MTWNFPSTVWWSRSVTVQSVIRRTPWPSSQRCKGTTRESYWFSTVRLTPARVSMRENSSMKRCR